MIRQKHIPVLFGLIILSGMFLLGQESWPPKPIIDQIEPSSGCTPDQVIISGSGFGSVQAESTIIFCGTDAGEATSWNDSQIQISVPSGLYNGDCPVTVSVGGQASNESIFTVDCVLTPVLESVSINLGGGSGENSSNKIRCVIGQSGVVGQGSDSTGSIQVSAGTIYTQEANVE